MNKHEILIIDDSDRFRKSIQFALKSEGYIFIEAESVREAINILQEHPTVKVILLDLSLPDGSGQDFLEKIGDPSSYRVIILTAHDEQLTAERAREFSVFNYLPKASRAFTESLRFSVAQAFIDIENEYLKNKNKVVIEIQNKINTEILESTSIDQTLKSLDEILTLICKSVIDLVGAYTCHIRLYSLSKGELYLAAFAGPDDHVKRIFYNPNGYFSGRVAKTKQTEIYSDLQNNEQFNSFKEEQLEKIRKLNDASLLAKVENYFVSVRSSFIIPITTRMFDDEADAVFNVSSDSVDFFSKERQEIIKEFVTLATTAITKAWQKKRKVESHLDYWGISAVLEEISKELEGIVVEDKIYEKFLKGISKIIRPEMIRVFLYNKKTKLLDNKAAFIGNKIVLPRKEGHPLDTGLTGRVFRDGKPIRIPNLQEGDRRKFQEHADYSREYDKKIIGNIPSERIIHYLGVPMIIGKNVIGVVELINKKSAYYQETDDKERWLLERGFSSDAESVLGIAASHLAVSIKNAELLEERDRKIHQLETLKDVGRYTSSEMPLDDLLSKIIVEAAKDVRAEICLLFLLDENKSKVVLEQCYGIPKENLAEAYYQIGEGLSGKVALTGEPRFISTLELTGKYDNEILKYLHNTHGRESTIESLMVVPIKAKGEILGVIKAINKKGEGEQYNEEDLAFFETFAHYVGIAIENARRYELASKRLAIAESNSTLSNLVASVAHEINNTAGLIPDNIQEILDLPISNISERDELLDEINSLAMQMVSYVSEIRGYSKSKSGELQLLDINSLTQTALKQIPEARKITNIKSVSLKHIVSNEPLICLVNENPFIQTIRNIIINAYQALEDNKKGEITVRTYKDVSANKAKVEITDNGCGIKQENQSKIFDIDFSTKGVNGNGIGLWLAKRHIESIGGYITFNSLENKGTTFILSIPIADNTM